MPSSVYRSSSMRIRCARFAIAITALLSLWPCVALADAPSLVATELRCEYRRDPLGVDAPQPQLSWLLTSDVRGQRQVAYRVLVASSPELLTEGKGDLWDSGKVDSNRTTQIAYAGAPLTSRMTCWWKVRVWDKDGRPSAWSAPAQWTMGLLTPAEWKASWIGSDALPALTTSAGEKTKPLAIFRRELAIEKPIKRALAFICGLGFHELSINGQNVGDHVLEPGWTNYRKTCLYVTYDVKGLLKQGQNAIGVMLGNGMYNVEGGRYVKFKGTFGPPKFIAQLFVEYEDGSVAEWPTDANWKASCSPIVFSCIYGGEDYDARLEQQGWNLPGFDDARWVPATPCDGPGGSLVAQSAPPIQVMETFKTPSVVEPKPGVWVFDLRQNFSGWPQVTVRGPAGKAIKLVCGELLDETGLVTQRSSGGPSFFTYTLKGQGEEVWHPRFSYYGFRYVQVEGATRNPDDKALPFVVDIQGQFVHAAAECVGEFSCSNALFNQIHAIIKAAIRSNMQSVFTDCPHREKLGWLEETHLLGPAILYNYDVPTLYAKNINDMAEAQLENGLVPDIAPEYVVFDGGFRDSPEWGSASVINPWALHAWYGDTEALQAHYDTMKRYVDYLTSRSEGHIVSHGLGDWCDLGPGPAGYSQLTPLPLTATAIYYWDVCILAQTALRLGRAEDAKHYQALADQVRQAFNAKFFDATAARYATGSQCANAMPIVLGLAPPERKADLLNRIVEDVRASNNQVTAGDVGHRFLLVALGEGGRSDVIFDMTNRTDTPGYGYQIAHGATTLVETWDAKPGMSQNHFMLGHIEEWFYRYLAGIQQESNSSGFERIVIKPAIVGDITETKATYRSIRGPISSWWLIQEDGLHLDVTIPPNTTATIYVPIKEGATITERGQPIEKSAGVTPLRKEPGYVVFAVEAGHYTFLSSPHGK